MVAARSQPLTFISYSRADNSFALELARELRASGFNIWLDQLDIPTGCRWDDEVEKALMQCDIFLVILTPHSIGSNNVKDEIGYAIDSNKRILPVLLENAAVPFRLRRFQYVNFTGKNYEEGIEASKQLLQTQVNKLLSTGDWVAVSAQTGGNRLLPKSLVEQQRVPSQAQPGNKQTLTPNPKAEKEKSVSEILMDRIYYPHPTGSGFGFCGLYLCSLGHYRFWQAPIFLAEPKSRCNHSQPISNQGFDSYAHVQFGPNRPGYISSHFNRQAGGYCDFYFYT